jgi:hypothetical protein
LIIYQLDRIGESPIKIPFLKISESRHYRGVGTGWQDKTIRKSQQGRIKSYLLAKAGAEPIAGGK